MAPDLKLGTKIFDLGSNSTGHKSEPESNKIRSYKFVIIRTQELLHFVYGPLDEYFYHADLVKKYCDINSIPSGWLNKPSHYEIYGNTHRVKGGGWLEKRPDEKLLKIFGTSTAYGRFQREDIVYLFQNAAEFQTFRISIKR